MKLKAILIIVLCLCIKANTWAQFLPFDSIFIRTARQDTLCLLEKVYLHTDKNNYVAGEKIWMRAHVVNGTSHAPMKHSRYVYATLQDPFLKTVANVRMLADTLGYIYGHIDLPIDLPKGEYTLSAYTQYMKNFEEDFFFRKRIFVNTLLNNTIQMKSKQEGKHLKVQFVNPATHEVVMVNNCVAETAAGGIPVSKDDNEYDIKLFDSKQKNILVQAGNYKEFVSLGIKPDYDVSFLPEGGNMVPGAYNRVAFKAINERGQSENITGMLYDEKDSLLFEFSSLYRGMGMISFVPEVGRKYTAVCRNEAGIEKRFELPEAKDKYTLQVNRFKGRIYIKVITAPDAPKHETLTVFAHQRGWPININVWDRATSGLMCFPGEFMDGTVSFLLIDRQGKIVSERMIFIRHGKNLARGNMKVTGNLSKREKITLDVQLEDSLWNGNCSVAITDNTDVKIDSCTHLLSSLLLTSDLKGHIEAPAWYFKPMSDEDSKKLQEQALDILMMTQGWKKYDLEKTWKAKYQKPKFRPEYSQTITGKVMKRVSNLPVENAKVRLMVPNLGIMENVQADSLGRFVLTNFDAPENTLLWINAYSARGRSNVVLELDTIVPFMLKHTLPPYRHETSDSLSNETSFEYLAKTDLRLLHETGIRHYFLDEVLVTAPLVEEQTEYEKTALSQSVKEEEISKSGVTDMMTLLFMKAPGLRLMEKKDPVTNETYTIIGLRSEPVAIIMDGSFLNPLMNEKTENQMAMDLLRNMSVVEVAQIDIIRGAQAVAYHTKAAGGVIAITTKRGGKGKSGKHPTTNIKTIMPLGFQEPVAFYAPRYELAADKAKDTPDLRTTIHWQPQLEVKNGKATINFYTADGWADYSVVVEGVSENGSLLRLEEQITRN